MLVAFTPRPQRERCHSERCEALCTPPSCFRKGLALAWNRTRNGLGAGAAVVDPTPCTFRRKRGTDRHHLPGRHPEPRLPHGSHGQTRPGPGRQVECTPKPGKKKAPVPAPNGGETGQAMGSAPPYPTPRRREWVGRPLMPGTPASRPTGLPRVRERRSSGAEGARWRV
jgi:hypothetical protein